MSSRNQLCQRRRVYSLPNVQLGTVNRQTSFYGRGGACSAHKLPFSGHTKMFQGPSILQLNMEGLTASKMNVPNHLATEHEALIILLQETHCTSAEKHSATTLCTSWVFTKQEARPCHVCSRATAMNSS